MSKQMWFIIGALVAGYFLGVKFPSLAAKVGISA